MIEHYSMPDKILKGFSKKKILFIFKYIIQPSYINLIWTIPRTQQFINRQNLCVRLLFVHLRTFLLSPAQLSSKLMPALNFSEKLVRRFGCFDL